MKINLKNFRQAHHLFQSEMAEILGLTQSSISRAENRGSLELTYPQLRILIDKYGKEDVESFMIMPDFYANASNNSNEGDVILKNGVFETDISTMNIIKQQSEAIIELTRKMNAQTDKLIDLIQKLSEKL